MWINNFENFDYCHAHSIIKSWALLLHYLFFSNYTVLFDINFVFLFTMTAPIQISNNPILLYPSFTFFRKSPPIAPPHFLTQVCCTLSPSQVTTLPYLRSEVSSYLSYMFSLLLYMLFVQICWIHILLFRLPPSLIFLANFSSALWVAVSKQLFSIVWIEFTHFLMSLP